MFSGLSETAPQQVSSTGGSKKFLLVAVVILAIAAGYFGWNRLQSGTSAAPKSAAPAIAPSLAPQSQAEAPVTPSAEVTPDSNTTAEPEVIISRTPIQQPAQAQAETNSKTSSSKPSAGIATEAATKESPSAKAEDKTEAPIVVATNTSAPKAAAPVEETADAPAPDALGTGADSKALSGIVNANPASLPKQPPTTIKISQGVSEGLLIKKVKPIYPPHALQVRMQGEVLLQANIGKDGSIVSVRQVNGDVLLGKAAMDAVRQWKYKPYFLNGEPVEVQTQITVNFKLP